MSSILKDINKPLVILLVLKLNKVLQDFNKISRYYILLVIQYN